MRVLLIEDDELIAHGMEADVAMDYVEEGVARLQQNFSQLLTLSQVASAFHHRLDLDPSKAITLRSKLSSTRQCGLSVRWLSA
jgi:hypothetical protein